MKQISLTQEELEVLIDLLERRKEELRHDETGTYIRKMIKQILEKLDAEA